MEANAANKQEVIGCVEKKDRHGETKSGKVEAGMVAQKVIPAGKVLALHATVIYNTHYYENIEKSQVHHRYGAL